jgi:tRNA(Arg) A34 adenosine deaminase TadA
MTDPPDTSPHTPFLQRAITLSVGNVAQSGGPFGAVVVRDGRILAEGVNRVTTTNDPTAHAEIVAIRAACQVSGAYSLTGCILYSSCEPCPMCLVACYWSRLDAVYFAATHDDAARAGFDDAFLYEELARPASERRLPVIALPDLRGAASEAFAEWAREGRRVEY